MQSNLPVERTLEHVVGKNNIKDAGTAELRDLSEKYPYFAAAQFLLAKKYQSEDNPLFTTQVKKAALHFSNPLWLWYNLASVDVYEAEIPIVPGVAEEDVTNITNVKSAATEPDADISYENSVPGEAETPKTFAGEIHIPEENTNTEEVLTIQEMVPEATDKIGDLVKNQLAEYDKPVDENTPLIAEPKQYYRVDYFASQGIKLSPQEETGNKLDAKVKRFTDWLKQMKRIGPQPGDLGTDVASESLVQVSAEHSNQPGEVITEAMAEVLVRQGKLDKAEELYLKLSLLYPDKSAYFAARIQELKGL